MLFVVTDPSKWYVDDLTRKLYSIRCVGDIELCLNCFEDLRRPKKLLIGLSKDIHLDERLVGAVGY